MSQGILYILYDLGSPIAYLDELKASIQSLRKYCDLPITVYTDRDPIGQWWGFDNVNLVKIDQLKELAPSEPRKDKHNRGHTFLKLYAFKDLPYDSTIFVDVDTIFLDDPSKLISEEHDLSICRDIKYINRERPLAKTFNTGFFVAKKGKVFSALIEKAIKMREEGKGDQAAINKAMDFTFDINVRILPQRWNVRGKIRESVDNPCLLHWHGVGQGPCTGCGPRAKGNWGPKADATEKFGEVVELADTADLKSAED